MQPEFVNPAEVGAKVLKQWVLIQDVHCTCYYQWHHLFRRATFNIGVNLEGIFRTHMIVEG